MQYLMFAQILAPGELANLLNQAYHLIPCALTPLGAKTIAETGE
jgi:hypothetical protein